MISSKATSSRKEQEKIEMKNQAKKTFTKDYGLFVVRVRIGKGKLIEELMSDEAKQATGLNKLSAQELANLNSWLDLDRVLGTAPIADRTEIEPRTTSQQKAEGI